MTRKIWLSIAIIGLFGSLVSQSAAQTIWYVDGALETNGDGQTWETAFNNLQSALSEATADQSPRDQIWVATQTYKPQLPAPPADPRTAIFEIPSGVEVYGGFVFG